MKSGGLLFTLNKSIIYQIHIHDPNFFMLTTNPITVPKIEIRRGIRSRGNREFYEMLYIRATRHVKMNRADAPCGDSAGYSFVRCLKNSISQKAGCRLEGDRVSSDDTTRCKDFDQLLTHEAFYHTLFNMEQREVVETTGCALPCEYVEYQQQGPPSEYGDSFGFGVTFATTEVLVKEDILVYPLLSFIAEFGGALGLFLGFSLNMLWDIFVWAAQVFNPRCCDTK